MSAAAGFRRLQLVPLWFELKAMLEMEFIKYKQREFHKNNKFHRCDFVKTEKKLAIHESCSAFKFFPGLHNARKARLFTRQWQYEPIMIL